MLQVSLATDELQLIAERFSLAEVHAAPLFFLRAYLQTMRAMTSTLDLSCRWMSDTQQQRIMHESEPLQFAGLGFPN